MIIDVHQYSAFFADGGAGVGIHTFRSCTYPVPATGTRFPWITYRLSAINNLLASKPTPKLSSNPNPNPCSSKKTPLAYQCFHFFEAFQPNSTRDHFMRHPVQQIVYKCSIHLPKLNFRAEYNA